jgi:SAM-dependent methyltransferase
VEPAPSVPASEARFRSLDSYRVDREWKRYEGTAQRDLFRQLRVRFLHRHPPLASGPILEVGPGPGRFTRSLAPPAQARVLLDLSVEALHQVRRRVLRSGSSTDGEVSLVRGSGRAPPFRGSDFAGVYLLGNLVGFAGLAAEELLTRSADLVAPGGLLLVELSPGEGEASVYLHRLPSTALARLLSAPVAAVLPRVNREGFAPLPPRRPKAGEFARLSVPQVEEVLLPWGFEREAALSVAPALGSDPARCEAIRTSIEAWTHLLDLEEALGGAAERWRPASAVLLALRRKP